MNEQYFSLGPVIPIYDGDYNPAKAYVFNRLVRYDGKLWWHVGADATTGVAPGTNSAVWVLSNQDGEKGDPFVYDDFTDEQLEGLRGLPGHTPYIQNGTWWLNGVDTGVEATAGAEEAARQAVLAAQSAVTAAAERQAAETARGEAVSAANASAGSATAAAQSETNAAESKDTAETAATSAAQSAGSAEQAKEAAETANTNAQDAKASAEAAQKKAEDAANEAEETLAGKMDENVYDPQGYKTDIFAYIGDVGTKRYGVSGVGGANTTLTRLWDSVGLTASVSTDTDDGSYQNDFDNIAPFNRKKCVGRWEMVQTEPYPKARFIVGAYYGDPDYTEDGTKGDYVAVEVEPFWYFQDLENGVLGVSEGQHAGWKMHPVCIDTDGKVRAKTYLPCYQLAQKDRKAVSLPGLFPNSGSYKGLWDKCRTYNGAAILEPMAVRHYEWLLFTIEFATTNCQSKMQGAVSMAYSNTAPYQATVATTGEDNNNRFILANNAADNYVVGQALAIGTSAYAETYKRIITAIEVYDDANKALVFDGAALDVPVGFWSSSRPWKTGSCESVLKPSGSPVSNSDGKHIMRYRWRENVWGNSFSTCGDLIDKLEGAGTEEDPRRIEWYALVDPSYYPSGTSKPDEGDLNTAAWKKLSQTTEHAGGYIKEMAADENYPHFIVPVVQRGASASTYFCDYGYFVNGTQGIRAVRLGGDLYSGLFAGVLFFYASHAVSYADWYYGGGLYFLQ